jgi:DNA-binding CsgD family transcriptional regulator
VSRRTIRAAPPGWESLTESERKLIPLVVEGLTNRAIADRLYVSVHTVNTHMKHIFTKLGINTRVELTRLVVGRGGIANGADWAALAAAGARRRGSREWAMPAPAVAVMLVATA